MSLLMLAVATAGLGAAVAAWAVLRQLDDRAVVRASLRQLADYEVDSVRERELLVPLRERVARPVLTVLTRLGGRFTPAGYVAKARRKLRGAGRPDAEALERFLAVRVVTAVAAPVATLLVLGMAPVDGIGRLAMAGFVGFALFAGPDVVLDRRVEERREAVRRKLPDILDLLVISVEAGLGFEQAIDRTVDAVEGPLSDELARMLGEVRAGASRADALRALDERTDVPEVRSFVLAILQADTFGVSIGSVLRNQAAEMRVKRRQLAQEKAQKAPVKMLIPMVFCIFPALFVIILGPAALNIMEAFGGG